MTHNPPPGHGQHWVSLEVAANHVGVTRKTLRRRVAEGELPAYRMAGSRLIRVNIADVEALFRRIPTR
jgi:excisionase family DNA binding protein